LIGKEEMLEVESRIEKILGKMPSLKELVKKPVIEKDITEKPGDNVVVDKAEKINDEKEVEPHIAELFSRKSTQVSKSTEAEAAQEDRDRDVEISEDNTVRDVTESVAKDKEDEPVKVPRENGSK